VARTAASTAPATTSTITTTAPEAATRSEAHEDDGHRRVLLVGDSLMFGARNHMKWTFAAQDVEVRFVGFPGTGLLSGQGWWNREVSAAVEEWKPDVIVVETCCNYSNSEPEYELEDGTVVDPDSAEMYDVWRDLAVDLVQRAGADGAELFWVVAPDAGPFVQSQYRTRIAMFNAIVDELGVARIDWASALDASGSYHASMFWNGEWVQVRDDDGLHFTDAGNEVVATATWEAVASSVGRADG
jgi:hypothetical protein